MKANNTLNISDLANWINFQLSTIIEGISAGYTLGNYNSVWIDRGATVFTVSLATGEEIEINSDNYATAEDIAKAIISVVNNNTPTTSDTMNTETKAMKEVTVTISPDGSDLYAATVNGITVGSVNTWFNNTFAASYNFGINTRKRLGMPELNNANDAAHGFMTEHNAVLWLGDMIARYFAGYGITANIVNA